MAIIGIVSLVAMGYIFGCDPSNQGEELVRTFFFILSIVGVVVGVFGKGGLAEVLNEIRKLFF